MSLLETDEFPTEGVLVARAENRVLGVLLCLPIAGATGLVWPPQVVESDERRHIEDQLVQSAAEWLQRKGVKLAQTLLRPADSQMAEALLRNGFRHITRLAYLRRDLHTVPALRTELRFVSYDRCGGHLFEQTLLRSYEGTRDCPEVNDRRSIKEILQGHRAQGTHHPDRWWLAFAQDKPVGVLLLAEMPEWGGWDLSYLGIVPEARRNRYGTDLARKAMLEAQAAGSSQLTLSVDCRNQPAFDLYLKLGFEAYDYQEVYLAFGPLGREPEKNLG